MAFGKTNDTYPPIFDEAKAKEFYVDSQSAKSSTSLKRGVYVDSNKIKSISKPRRRNGRELSQGPGFCC